MDLPHHLFSAVSVTGYFLQINVFLLFVWTSKTDGDWCNLDTGYTTITDGHGYPHSVYISVTRDGSIWMRTGQDHKSLDWMYETETRYMLQSYIIDQDMVNMLESINYTDYCVLTDVDMMVQARGGWHPSFFVAFDPKARVSKILLFKRNKEIQDCHVNTNLTFTRDKQGITCNGGTRHACGVRNLPLKGQSSDTLFLKTVTLDPQGPENWLCTDEKDMNDYTFKGSYYHAYVKLASCSPPKDSRILGHEAKLRPHRDTVTNTVLIPDPSQTALNHGTITGWLVFAKIISIQHEVYLQVWRPSAEKSGFYTLIAQTFFHPTELRFQEVRLKPGEHIHVRRGDVLGLYYPSKNPLAYSSVPCAYEQQQHQFVRDPTDFHVGYTLRFKVAPPGEHACRHYSFTAMFANKSNSKLVEDWICPTAKAPPDLRRFSGASMEGSNSDHSAGGYGSVTQRSPGQKHSPHSYTTDGSVPIHLILIIIGCLILLLIIIGSISYYRAMKS